MYTIGKTAPSVAFGQTPMIWKMTSVGLYQFPRTVNAHRHSTLCQWEPFTSRYTHEHNWKLLRQRAIVIAAARRECRYFGSPRFGDRS